MTKDELKAAIREAVYENTNGEITGGGLQEILLALVDTLECSCVIKAQVPKTDVNIEGTAAECAQAAGMTEEEFIKIFEGYPVILALKSESFFEEGTYETGFYLIDTRTDSGTYTMFSCAVPRSFSIEFKKSSNSEYSFMYQAGTA